MRRFLLIILYLYLIVQAPALAQPKHEIRAAWLTTAYGLDWPSKRATTPQGVRQQKAELCRLLDQLQEANFNTILFQVRIRGDVAYPSAMEPFNEIFTGKEGVRPAYDPLAFAVSECHKRGMELHAWMVTIPLGSDSHVKNMGKLSIRQRQPSLCKKHKGEWYLDPGNPETKNYLMKLVGEVVTNYDVDGIHFDYIRYPDRPTDFPDEESFRKYGKGKTLANWRRENITTIVRHLYNGTKSIKPWIKVSSSPIGKFNDTSRYSSSGWNAYNTVYQDAQGWLREGIQDMLFPMMYFRGNGFFPFALDWQEKCYGRFIIPGLGIYFLHPSEKDWPLEEIERQIYFTRSQGLAGQAYFRTRFLTNNTKRLTDELICNYYAYPALLPPMTWLDNIAPSVPKNLNIQETPDNTILITWSPSVDNDPRIKPHYAVYASSHYPVDTECAKNIIAPHVSGNQFVYMSKYLWDNQYYFAVTAVDRYGNESPAVQLSLYNQQGSVKSYSNSLFLPVEKKAEFIIITDIGGRSIMCTSYATSINIDKLAKGYYRYMLADSKGNVLLQDGFFKL